MAKKNIIADYFRSDFSVNTSPVDNILPIKLPDCWLVQSCRFKGGLQLLSLWVCGGPGSLKVEYRTEHCVRTGVYWLFQVSLLQSLSDACSNLERCLGCLVTSVILLTIISFLKMEY